MSKKRGKENDVIVTFLGSSVQQVTGSCIKIEYKDDNLNKNILFIECGLPQGSKTPLTQYSDMERMVGSVKKGFNKPNEYSNINAILSHVHVDHIGLLPIFNSENGFNGKIYCSEKSKILAKPLLEDCFKIHNSNVNYLKRKGKKHSLLYTSTQLYDCLDRLTGIPLNQEITIDSNLKVVLRPNCHTVDSVNIMIIIRKPNTNRTVKICYTGDIGNSLNYSLSNYLTKQDIPEKADLVISEATYSKKPELELTKKIALEERNELKELILKSLKEGRRILLPTFSFARSQQLITYFYEWFKDDEFIKNNNIQFVMDSNLMLKINNCYSKILEGKDKDLFNKVMNWHNLKKIDNYDGTMAFLSQKTPSVVLTSSGFLDAGKSTEYLRQYCGNSKCDVIITGYCANDCEGSMAWKLFNENQKTITFSGDSKRDRTTVVKRCGLYEFNSFSGHASYSQLLDIFSKFNVKKILIHHCNNESKDAFVKEANQYLRDKNKTTNVVAVNKGSYEFKL